MNKCRALDTSGMLHSPQAAFTSNRHITAIRSTDSDRQTDPGRFDGKKIVHLMHYNRYPFGVSLRTIGQAFLQEGLMMGADEAPIIII